ncbi:histidine kinase [Psychroserpens sp. S379A]|uniref:histidine kinase n=1 Tax=Psychroserpens sp. S379A TaxID=3415137 RepID=UPI003C7A00A3
MTQLNKKPILTVEQFENLLVYFSNSFIGKENEDDILWDLAKNCISKLGLVDCVIYVLDKQKNVLVQKAAYGPKNPKDKNIHNPVDIKLGEGITGSVAKTGNPEIISDTSKDNRYIIDDEQRLSEICVPIAYEDIIYGVIDCEHPEKNFFTNQHLKMFSAIASICAVKIKSIRANNALIKKQQKFLQIKEEMLALKLQALKSQLNPHFVFNAINAIQYFITEGNKKSSLEYLSIFSKLIRFYLKYLEEDLVYLKDEVNMLNWYLKLQELRYSNRFKYTINIDNSSELENTKIPAFVIQTLFENIIEYAIINQHNNQSLNANFKVNNNNVILTIEHKYDAILESEIQYSPEYRTQITKWQDQIQLLNTIKNYNIEKHITLIKDNSLLKGTLITLKLPNLN